jgi:methylated-DNA-[protein]-cysteine S-methyltransferase
MRNQPTAAGEQTTSKTLVTPLGNILAVASVRGLMSLAFVDGETDHCAPHPDVKQVENEHLRELEDELDGYFNGSLRRFNVALDLRGTPFQLGVWKSLSGIAFGSVITYADQARQLGAPGSTRAVAAANAANPLAIVIPCHRVIGSDGALRGYAWGLQRKQLLLEHERAGGVQLAITGLAEA